MSNELIAAVQSPYACPKCSSEKRSDFDKWSIEKRRMCVDCGKKVDEAAYQESLKKEFEVSVSASANFTVKALDQEEAEEIAIERFTDEIYDYDVRAYEVKKK